MGGRLKFNEQEWDDFIKEYDKNGDGDVRISLKSINICID